jgi:hypothetical protein
MELEQVWSLHVPEEHDNRVRSPEVPPMRKIWYKMLDLYYTWDYILNHQEEP